MAAGRNLPSAHSFETQSDVVLQAPTLFKSFTPTVFARLPIENHNPPNLSSREGLGNLKPMAKLPFHPSTKKKAHKNTRQRDTHLRGAMQFCACRIRKCFSLRLPTPCSSKGSPYSIPQGLLGGPENGCERRVSFGYHTHDAPVLSEPARDPVLQVLFGITQNLQATGCPKNTNSKREIQ